MMNRTEKLEAALRKLVDAGRTTGGVAGRDEVLCEALDNAEAALATPPTSEWQPIKTAPKYGGRILLARIDESVGMSYHVWWACAGEWSERWGNWNDGVEPSGLACPNYWMPIPLPPADIRALKRKEQP